MRKLFNYALLAAALLVGVNVNAVNVNSYAQLKAAIEAENGADITLTANIEFPTVSGQIATYPKYGLLINKGQTVTINLNGYSITRDYPTTASAADRKVGFMFTIVHGTLNLTGEGSLIGKGDVHTGFASVMGGTYLKTVNGIVYCSDSTTSTTLSETNRLTYGLDAIGVKTWTKLDPTKKTGGIYECQGDASIIYLVGTNANTKSWSNLTIGKDVNILNENGKDGVYVYCNNSTDTNTAIRDLGAANTKTEANNNSYHYANGVNIDIHGYIKSYQYGVQVTGQIRKPADTAYAAHINIHPEAKIEVASDWAECTGIYAAGYALWNISGTVSGSTGVYIKSGDVDIVNANISSTNTNPIETVGKGGGVTAGGSGVVIESNASYAGEMNVTIGGDTKITGASGYGIEQIITTGTAAQLDSINIIGGEIGSGEKGTFIVDAQDTSKVSISAGSSAGGTTWQVIDKTDPDNPVMTEVNVNNFIPEENGKKTSHIINVYGENEDDIVMIIVVPGPAPTPIDCDNFSLDALANDTSIDLSTCAVSEELTKDLVLKELIMNSPNNNQKITVKDGNTLTVQYLTMGGHANITVEAGGMLIVSGDMGVKNVSTDNIILKSEVNKPGQFLFAPEVVSNKHPKATVEYKTEAINNTNYDRIGVPAYNGMKVKDIKRDNFTIQLWIYDNATGWISVTTKEQLLAPFQGLTLRTAATSAPTLGFPCELVGNTDANLTIYTKWNTFSNSYTANADLTPFLRGQCNAGEDALLEASIHKYNPSNSNGQWDVVSLQDIDEGEADGELKPMQAIIIRNITNKIGNLPLSYKDNVWENRPGAVKAPRMVTSANVNKAVINITSANGMTDKLTIREAAQYTEQFDNGSDATKYPNNLFNMYVATEFGDLCQFASNNVEGQVITLATTNETEFTMSFSNVRGEKMALRDNLTGDVIEMAEGVEYHFMANANEVSERFTVVSAAKAPTAIENAAAKAKAAKFINKGQVVLQNNGRTFNVLGVEL